MTILNKKLWKSLPILMVVALVSSATVGGAELAFASLGAMVLIGMASIGIYVLAKALRRSGISLKGGYPKFGSTSAVSFDGDDLKEAEPITEKDKRIIMEHVDDLFEIVGKQSQEKPAEAVPIGEQDKRLIMGHINELFAKEGEQSREMPAEIEPISDQDKKLIMKNIDEFFKKGLGQSEGKSS